MDLPGHQLHHHHNKWTVPISAFGGYTVSGISNRFAYAIHSSPVALIAQSYQNVNAPALVVTISSKFPAGLCLRVRRADSDHLVGRRQRRQEHRVLPHLPLPCAVRPATGAICVQCHWLQHHRSGLYSRPYTRVLWPGRCRCLPQRPEAAVPACQ